MRMKKPAFGSVVFAGGGCRCVWQAGFWSVAAGPLGLDRVVIGSVEDYLMDLEHQGEADG